VWVLLLPGYWVALTCKTKVAAANVTCCSQDVGRLENIVGWYHSHPGYGCWLSGIDCSTQMLNQQFQVQIQNMARYYLGTQSHMHILYFICSAYALQTHTLLCCWLVGFASNTDGWQCCRLAYRSFSAVYCQLDGTRQPSTDTIPLRLVGLCCMTSAGALPCCGG
jgi:hypothetical protein